MPVSLVIPDTHALGGDIEAQAPQLANARRCLIAAHLAQFVGVVGAHHKRFQDTCTLGLAGGGFAMHGLPPTLPP